MQDVVKIPQYLIDQVMNNSNLAKQCAYELRNKANKVEEVANALHKHYLLSEKEMDVINNFLSNQEKLALDLLNYHAHPMQQLIMPLLVKKLNSLPHV